jgi:hypothetical protein
MLSRVTYHFFYCVFVEKLDGFTSAPWFMLMNMIRVGNNALHHATVRYKAMHCGIGDVYTVAKPGVSKWGVKGEGTRGGVPPPVGGPGAVPPEKFSNYRWTQVSFSAFFRQKSTH